MGKQLIISLGREFGSIGHEIAEKLAEHYGLPLYDNNLLKQMAEDKQLTEFDADEMKELEEKKNNFVFYRTVNGYSNSPAKNIAYMQFDFMKKKAEAGESFVIVGRCSEQVLKEYEGLISIFVLEDMEDKVHRIMSYYDLPEKKAKKLIKYKNKKRKDYHNTYCEGKWGDSRNYDISVNCSRLSLDEATKLLINYIDERREDA